MIFIPNTKVDIYRGSNLLDPDEEVDYSTAVASNVEALIQEQQQTTSNKSSTQPRALRQAYGRVLTSVGVRRQDRLKDNNSGAVWVVEEVLNNGNAMVAMGTRLLLTRQG